MNFETTLADPMKDTSEDIKSSTTVDSIKPTEGILDNSFSNDLNNDSKIFSDHEEYNLFNNRSLSTNNLQNSSLSSWPLNWNYISPTNSPIHTNPSTTTTSLENSIPSKVNTLSTSLSTPSQDTTPSSIPIQNMFNAKPFNSLASVESPLMHSDSEITLINSNLSSNENITTTTTTTTLSNSLLSQYSRLSLDNSSLAKTSSSPNLYGNMYFNEPEPMIFQSPIQSSTTPSQIIRHNSMPMPTNSSLLFNIEKESEFSHLTNDIDLLIRSSQLKFEDLLKYKDELGYENVSVDILNRIKKELFIQGWYQHAYYSIRKIKDRLQEILKLPQNVWMVDIDIYVSGNIDVTLYYFKLHINTCYDLKNCIVSEWTGSKNTEISNWWASTNLLFNQILLLFKLSELPLIQPIEDKNTREDQINGKEEENTSGVIFPKKLQAIGRKGSSIVTNHTSLSSTNNSINSSSNITSPLATSSTIADTIDSENLNDELILNESDVSSTTTTTPIPTITTPGSTIPVLSPSSNAKFPYPGTNIYIRGLPINTTDESLYSLCIRWGKIISSKAIVDMRTYECKGFGFVMYETEEQARTALAALNNVGYHVSFAKSMTHASQESYSTKLKNLEDMTSMNIYISNLPLDYDNEKLLALFGDYKVLSHRILKNNDGTSRGVGFARFCSREIAQRVIDTFNNVTLKGAKYPLQVRFADSIAQKKLKNQVATRSKRKESIKSSSSSYKKTDEFDTKSTKSQSKYDLNKSQSSQSLTDSVYEY